MCKSQMDRVEGDEMSPEAVKGLTLFLGVGCILVMMIVLLVWPPSKSIQSRWWVFLAVAGGMTLGHELSDMAGVFAAVALAGIFTGATVKDLEKRVVGAKPRFMTTGMASAAGFFGGWVLTLVFPSVLTLAFTVGIALFFLMSVERRGQSHDAPAR